MKTKFEADFVATLNYILHETSDEELIRMIEEAEGGVYQYATESVIQKGINAMMFSMSFMIPGTVFPIFPQGTFFVKWDTRVANYEDLALAA